MVDFYKLVKRNRWRLGTLSTEKAAKRMLAGIEESSLHRYGTDLYEQAWRYYITINHPITLGVVLKHIVLLTSVAACFICESLAPLSALVTTMIVYSARGACK